MQIITLSVLALGNLGFSGFQELQAVAEPQRLALTPVIDGKLEANEWDSYSGVPGKETFFQWEPGRIYAASKLGENEDMLVSIDAQSDGWLIGKANYDFRISINNGKPVLRARYLDSSLRSGPAWFDAPEFLRLSLASAAPGESGYIVECAIDDSGANLLRNETGKMGVRVDIVPTGQEFEAFLPRTMTQSEFVLDRASNVPGGLRWIPGYISRNVVAGQVMKVRFHFNGDPAMNLVRFDVDALHHVTEVAAKLSYPFPQFDRKGHTAIDFMTPIPANATTGYRTLRGEVTDSAGKTTFLRSSYRVAPLVELALNQQRNLKSSTKERKLKFSYFVQSNSLKRINCVVRIQVPTQWKILSGEVFPIVIYNSYSRQKRTFEVNIPADAKGSFPVTLTAKVGEKEFQDSCWIEIQ